MGYFTGAGTTKSSRDSNYVTPGHYIMRIESVRQKLNREDAAIFVIEMLPIHVIAKDLLEDNRQPGTMNGTPTFSNKKGVPCSHLISFTGPGKDMALPNIKAFAEVLVPGFAEAFGEMAIDPDTKEKYDVQERTLEGLVEEDGEFAQPLAGMLVEVIARSIVTQKSKKDFTKITYVQTLDDADLVRMEIMTQEQYDLLHPATDE